jgi:hypothetical protein
MKRCPFCDEDIQDQARKCKHCGEWLLKDKTNNRSLLGGLLVRAKEEWGLRKAKRKTLYKESRPAMRKCKLCGRERMTQWAYFQENMSYIFARQERTFDGFVCFPCMSMTFAKFEIRTLLFTWWGAIGFFVGPIYLVANLRDYLRLTYRFQKEKP